MQTSLFALILCLVLSNSCVSFAKSKLDIAFGYFSLTATSSKSSGSISGLGAYQFLYRQAFTPNVEFGVGYSLAASGVVGGDMGFGPDLGLYYYPMTSTNGEKFESSDITFSTSEHLKPYIGGGFHQRQFQSTQSSYAGFSFLGGCEYYWNDQFSLKAELRFLSLNGPSSSTANELNLLGGLSFGF